MLIMDLQFGNFTDTVKSNLTVSPSLPNRSNYRPMDSLKKIVARVERRLRALDLSATAASKKAQLSGSAIYNMQRGAKGKIATKGVNATTLSALAPVLKTSMNWLATGTGPEHVDDDHIESSAILTEDVSPARHRVRVVGYVGAGSTAHFYAIAQGDFEEVEAPMGATDQTVAVEIKGKSFGPLLDTWLVFYDDIRSPVTEDLHGEVCVIGLADDRILIKKLVRERDGSYTLVSNSNEEPIRKVEIEWAAKVTDMRPRR